LSNETYQAWTICEKDGCRYIGDAWWQRKDGEYYYYCPECKETHKTSITAEVEEYNQHTTLEL